MMILELISAIAIARYGGVLTDDYETATKTIGWVFVLLGVGLALMAGRHI